MDAMNTTDVPQLAPCPFCGGHARLRQEMTRDRTLESVTCDDCNIRFSRNTADDAAAAWNRRATIQAAEAQPTERDHAMEGMAECMDMVRQELIEAGIIDKSVPPMMVSNAVLTRVARAQREVEGLQHERDRARARFNHVFKVMMSVYNLAPNGQDITLPDGRMFRFNDPNAAETLDALGKAIRAIPEQLAEGGIANKESADKTAADPVFGAPQGAAVAQDDSPFQSQGWSKEAEMIESWRGAAVVQPVGEFIGFDGETSVPLVKWASMPKVGDTLYVKGGAS